jgi:hypothetical protein
LELALPGKTNEKKATNAQKRQIPILFMNWQIHHNIGNDIKVHGINFSSELLLIDSKMKGPGWLELKFPRKFLMLS